MSLSRLPDREAVGARVEDTIRTPVDAPVGTTNAAPGAATVDRLCTLMLHAIGHLAGLTEAPDDGSLLYRPESPEELDAMQSFTPTQRETLGANFAAIADTRLEDAIEDSRSRLLFHLQASWINRAVILDAVLAAQPWQFPGHLNRLTTAAVSTVAILLMTAESWDLGLSQTPSSLIAVSLIAVSAIVVSVSACETSRIGAGGPPALASDGAARAASGAAAISERVRERTSERATVRRAQF